MKKRFWTGEVGPLDDFGEPIGNEFIDGRTKAASWAIMSPKSWRKHGVTKLGTGYGQRYKRTDEGWLKVEG